MKEELLKSFHPLLERICGSLPLDITIYGKGGKCNLRTESCKYSLYIPEAGYLCKKKTYTLLGKPTTQVL
jgi:hypothetical protein